MVVVVVVVVDEVVVVVVVIVIVVVDSLTLAQPERDVGVPASMIDGKTIFALMPRFARTTSARHGPGWRWEHTQTHTHTPREPDIIVSAHIIV